MWGARSPQPATREAAVASNPAFSRDWQVRCERLAWSHRARGTPMRRELLVLLAATWQVSACASMTSSETLRLSARDVAQLIHPIRCAWPANDAPFTSLSSAILSSQLPDASRYQSQTSTRRGGPSVLGRGGGMGPGNAIAHTSFNQAAIRLGGWINQNTIRSRHRNDVESQQIVIG